MSNRTAFRRVKICIGIAARRSLPRGLNGYAAFCVYRLIAVLTNDERMQNVSADILGRAGIGLFTSSNKYAYMQTFKHNIE